MLIIYQKKYFTILWGIFFVVHLHQLNNTNQFHWLHFKTYKSSPGSKVINLRLVLFSDSLQKGDF